MLHIQYPIPDWPQAIPRLPIGSVVKAVDEGPLFREVKSIRPDVGTCLRHWYDPGQVFGGSWDENVDRARTFFATFIDETFRRNIAPFCNYVEEWNEYLANSQNAAEVGARVIWAKAAAHVWESEYRSQADYEHIRLVLCNTAIGNWIHRDFASIARTHDAVIGYHPYDYWENGTRGDEGMVAALSMLWDAMELDWGIKVDWLFTEAGPFQSAVDGWRSPNCLGGDLDLYRKSVEVWLRDVQRTPAWKEGRILGFNLFTTGPGGGTFASYQTQQPELNFLADTVYDVYQSDPPPAPTPPPPPDPEPNPDRGAPRLQYARVYNLISSEAGPGTADSVMDRAKVGKQTVGWSYDDAGIGDLDNRKVVIWDEPDDRKVEVLEWFRTWYPGTVVQFADTDTAFRFLRWPTEYPGLENITQGFGENPDRYEKYGLPGHEGIDFYAPEGSMIFPVAPGSVAEVRDDLADEDDPYGRCVIVSHRDGFVTLYAHLSAGIPVAEGDEIEIHEPLGRSGNTGNSTGPHLHLTLYQWDDPDGYEPGWPKPYVDPTPYIDRLLQDS